MTGDATEALEREREKYESAQTQLKSSVASLETRLNDVEKQLNKSREDLEHSESQHATARADLATLRTSHEQGRTDIEHLKKENSALEERARDAEKKVQLLLDQVEHSVDNYRRQSRLALDGQTTTMNSVHHARNLSAQSAQSAHSAVSALSAVPSSIGHSRNMSDGANSIYSLHGGDDIANGRDSLALDSLASELDALRSHWETTQNYRISDKFEFERTPTAATSTTTGPAAFGGSLATWRQDLDISDDGSRPGTSEGTVRDEKSPRLPSHSRSGSSAIPAKVGSVAPTTASQTTKSGGGA